MSYCVNCGVELDVSAKKCALCSTPVYNPNIVQTPSEEKPFSDTLQIPKSIKKRFIAFVVSVAMLVPNIVMFFLNVFFIKGSFWSIYVFSSCLLAWVLFVFPFFTKKLKPYLLWAFDTLAVSAFFFVFLRLLNIPGFVLNSVICVVLSLSVSVLFFMLWINRKKRHWTAIVLVVFLEIAIVALLTGVMVAVFTQYFNFFVVGIVISVCSIVMMCFFIYCNRSKHVRAWLNKAFYL
ncbi:MAG: hypothetical protein E7573_01560 [Ruminococcaceae bacterium]|nr:hypothetical protein [Oscillospiraceae bacterium]MBR3597668.1 hypothetical protein [Clostridia bacterium]